MNISIYILLILCILESAIIAELYKRLKASRFDVQNKSAEKSDLQDKLVDKVREKIEMTCRSRKPRINKDDLFAEYIYKQDKIMALGAEMNSIFHTEISAIHNRYPQLTELDVLVLSLYAIKMDNDEICELTQMEKRTLYRRRQLISQRIGLSSPQLEEFAFQLFNPED